MTTPAGPFGSLSLRSRVGLLAALGVGVAVALTALAGYLTVRVQLQRSVDANLLERARSAVSTPLGDPVELVRVPAETLLAADLRIALVTADGRAASAFGPVSAPPVGTAEVAVAAGQAPSSTRTARLGGDRYRVVAVPARDGVALVLGQPTAPVEDVLARLGLVSLVVGALGIGVAAWAGTVIGRTALRPVQRLTEAAERVAATGRLDPIEFRGRDELGRLARSFNVMLAALGEARARQRQLVADAGHELRTPLTSLRTNLDLLAQAEPGAQEAARHDERGRRPGPAGAGVLDTQERRRLLADVRAQVEELGTLVADLVELSREDDPVAARERLDLAEVVREAVERVRRRAPQVRFQVDAEPWLVDGDPRLLSRAVTNLLHNAAAWSPAGGRVRVSLHGGTLEVADEGPGIAEADLPHVFERFYRAADARGRPGSGLGLAIVAAAAQRHGGTVRAARAPGGGALMSMTLPGVRAGEDSSPPLARRSASSQAGREG